MATITLNGVTTTLTDENISGLLLAYTGTTGTVVATDATATQLNAIAAAISKIASGGITGNMALSNSQSSAQLTALFSKYAGTTATVNTTDMPAASLTVLANNNSRIASIPTAGTETYTDTHFAALGSKLADAETVKVDASAATAAELTAMLADSTNISQIEGTAIGAMTPAQFAGLGGKLADSVVDAKVNAASATVAQSAVMATEVANIAAGGITGTLINIKPADFTTLSASKFATTATAKIAVTAADTANGTDVAAMVTKAANIAASTSGGISVASDATLSMRDDQFVTLGPKLSDAVGSVATVNVVASDANATEVAAMVTNASNIRQITGTFAATGMDEVQFRSLGAKLADGDTPVTVAVNASSAIAGDIAIMADNASNISAITGTLIGAMTDEQFAVLGGKLADAVVDAKVIATSPDSTAVGVIVANAGNIAALGITGSNIALDEGQFQTLAPKLASTVTGITIDATGANAATFKPLFVTHAAKIANGGITGITGLALTDTEFATLGVKLGNAAGEVAAVTATVDAAGVIATELTKMQENADNISSITNLANGTILTGLQFRDLATKTTATGLKVTATAAGNNVASVVEAMDENADQIAALGITGSGFAATYDQFETLAGKFAAAVTGITIDGTDAAEVTPSLLVTHATKIAAGGISNLSALALDEVQFTTLAPKFDSAGDDAITDVTVDAAGATAAHVTALVTDADNIADEGITNFTAAVTDTQFNALAAKLDTDTTGIAVDATAATASEVATMATNADYISSITGTGIVMATPAQFTALGSKLAAAVSGVKVTATGAEEADVAALFSGAAKIAAGGITIAGTAVSVTDAQFVTLGAKLSDTAPISQVKVVASNPDSTEINAMETNAPNIVDGGISGTIALLTKAQFLKLGAKLANAIPDNAATEDVNESVPAVKVNVNATGTISAAEMTAMVANADNINDGAAGVGITGVTSAVISGVTTSNITLTKTQFNALGNKLADGVTVGVDLASTEVSPPAVADVVNVMANNASSIKNLGITAAGVTLNLTDTQFAALSNATADKFAAAITNISVDATNATSTEIDAMVAKTAHIGTITGTAATLTVSQFSSLAAKLDITDVTVDTTGADEATDTEITALTTNVEGIHSITGSDLSLTSADFVTLADKFFDAATTPLDDTDVDATVAITAVSNADDIDTLVENANNISTIAGTGLEMNLDQFLALGDKLADEATTVDGTGAMGTDIEFIVNNVDSIAPLGLSNTDSWEVLSAEEFLALQPKLPEGAVVDVTLEGATPEQILEVVALSDFIGSLEGATTFTAAQFAANAAKLPSGLTIDATGATSDEVDAMVANTGKISSITVEPAAGDDTPAVPATVFSATQFISLHSKLADGDTVIVDAEGASSTQITTLVTAPVIAKISAISGTPSAVLTYAQFDAFADTNPANGKLYVNQSEGEGEDAIVDPIPGASLKVTAPNATTDQKTLLVANADSIQTLTGSGLTFTAAEFAELGLKLGVSASVSATDMSSGVIKTVLLPAISKVSTITGDLVIDAAALDTQEDSTTDQATNLGLIFPKYTGSTAVVNATGFDVAAVNKLSTSSYLPKIASINGVLEFTSANSVAAITNLLAKDTETGANANNIIHATGMDAARITAVAVGVDKIAEIRGEMKLTSAHASVDHDANEATDPVSKLHDLLTKSAMPVTAEEETEENPEELADSVNANGMTATDLAVIATHIDKIGSITGTMSLDSTLSVAELKGLFTKDDDLANDEVVATGMDTVLGEGDDEDLSLLDVVFDNLGKIRSITGELALNNSYVDTEATDVALLPATDKFAKSFDIYDGTEITVDVAEMSPAALNKIAEGIVIDNAATAEVDESEADKVESITGVMALTALNDPDALAALLSTDATGATVNATGMQSDALDVLADILIDDATKIATDGITGVMELAGQDDAQLGALFSKYDDQATVDTTGMNVTALDVLVTNAEAISLIIAAGSETYTDTQFATLGAKMADGVSLVSVKVDATEATADEVAAMVTNKDNVATIVVSAPAPAPADPEILPTVFTATQFKDLAEKLANSSVVTVSTSGETDVTEIGVMLEQIDNIGNITVAEDEFLNLTVADLALLVKLDDTAKADVNLAGAGEDEIELLVADAVNVNEISNTDIDVLLKAADFNVLGAKLADESTVKVDASTATATAVDPDISDIAAMIANKENISSITASIDLAVTDFTQLGVKLADGVQVSVDASNGSEADAAAMVTDVDNISAITGETLPDLTDTQFEVLGDKLADDVVVTVNVEGASTAENIAAMAADSANIDAIFGTDVLMTAADFTVLGTLLDDTEDDEATAVVDITDANGTDIEAMVTDVLNISDIIGDGSSIEPLTAAQFKVLGSKLHDEDDNEETDDPTVLVSIATTSSEVELIEMVADADNIAAISGITELTLTDTEFTALGSKLDAETIEITVDATDATEDDVAAMLADADNIIDGGDDVIGEGDDDDVGITGVSELELTAEEFAILGIKLADSVTDVTVDATGVSPGGDELAAMIADVDNIEVITVEAAVEENLGAEPPVQGVPPTTMSAAQFRQLGAKLADGSQVQINAENATASDIEVLVAQADNIVDGSILGLSNVELDETQLAALGSKIASPAFVIDATGMTDLGSPQVDATPETPETPATGLHASSIRYITGALEITDEADLVLLGKYEADVSNVTVDMTSITADYYPTVITNINNGKITKLTGSLTLSVEHTAAHLAALLGVYADTAATVDVDTVDGEDVLTMSSEQLQIIAKHADAFADAGITGAMNLTAALSADDLADLLSKYADASVETVDATVDATDMSLDKLAIISTHVGLWDDYAISGEIHLGSIDAISGSGDTDGSDLEALFHSISPTNDGVTVNTARMNAAELDVVADTLFIPKIDTLVMTRTKGITVAAADVTGATLELSGGVLTVNGTTGNDTINLSNLSGKAGVLITGGDGADVITLNDSTADVVVLSSTDNADNAADTITGFHVNSVDGPRDKISVDAEPTLGGVAPLSVRLNKANVTIEAGLTKVATNAVDTQEEGAEGYGVLDAADIYAALTDGAFDLKLPANAEADDIYYVAIDNGTNTTAIARIDAAAADQVIAEEEITIVGILNGVSNVAALSSIGNFTGFGTLAP